MQRHQRFDGGILDSETGKSFHAPPPDFQVGQYVRVKQDEGAEPWQTDWRDIYVITGMRHEYQAGDGTRINYSLATVDEINHKLGDTDGFYEKVLTPA